jgi:hypothetical protein
MTNALDLDLHDADLIDEIHLVTELMAAAAASAQPLSQEAIDGILALPVPEDLSGLGA